MFRTLNNTGLTSAEDLKLKSWERKKNIESFIPERKKTAKPQTLSGFKKPEVILMNTQDGRLATYSVFNQFTSKLHVDVV